MGDITIEKIDEIISRMPHIRYEQAKEALGKSNGDVLDAIIYLESSKQNRSKNMKEVFEESLSRDSEDLKVIKQQALELIKRSSVIRVIVEKNSKVILNIPLTVGVVGVALGPVFALVGVSAALISRYEIKIQNEEDNTEVNLGKLNIEKINMLKNMIIETASDVKDAVINTKKDSKDITDELFDEYDFTKNG